MPHEELVAERLATSKIKQPVKEEKKQSEMAQRVAERLKLKAQGVPVEKAHDLTVHS